MLKTLATATITSTTMLLAPFVEAGQASRDRQGQEFALLNGTTFKVSELYVAPAVSLDDYTDNWGENLIGADWIPPKKHSFFIPIAYGASCEFDVRIVYVDEAYGEGAQEMFTVDLCENDTIHVTDVTTDWWLVWSGSEAKEAVEEVEA